MKNKIKLLYGYMVRWLQGLRFLNSHLAIQPSSHLTPRNRGFTLIEILVVIAIIGILATIGLATFPAAMAKARDTKRVDDAKKIIAALAQYYAENGSYPVVVNWVNSQGTQPWISGLTTSYMPEGVPIDPRNVSSPELIYWYRSPGSDYCIQISQERNATRHPNYKSTDGTVWRLRFGPSGPNQGECNN